MHRSWVSGCTRLLICVAALGAGVDGRAAEEVGPPKKYRAMVHRNGVEVETEFDRTNPNEVAEVVELVRDGRLESLQADRPKNILAISWDLGLWTIVVFGLLLYVLRKLAWKPWLEATQRRENSIQQARDDAQRARDEAQRLRDQFQGEMDRASEKVRGILDEARADAQRATDEVLGKARMEIQKERERLHREITMARDQALQEIWNQTAQLATLVSAKAIRRQLSTDDHRRLVDEAIAELRPAGQQRQREVASVQ